MYLTDDKRYPLKPTEIGMVLLTFIEKVSKFRKLRGKVLRLKCRINLGYFV